MKALIVAAGIAVSLASTGLQSLSTAEIALAIEQGRDGKTLQKKCSASGSNGFDIVLEGPVGRIMRAAREAKQQRRDFTAADVTSRMSAATLTVAARRDRTLTDVDTAEATRAAHTTGTVYRAELTIRSKPSGADAPVVLKPESISFPRDGSVATNMPRELLLPGSDMTASFDLVAFKAIAHRDVEVVVFMTDAGEHKCKINEKERQAIR